MLFRSPGDKILVTGTLGDSALGLKILKDNRKNWTGPLKARRWLIKRHLDPTPRTREALRLSRSNVRVTSMIDISDGLIQDLHHLCQAGNVGALVEESRLPHSPALTQIGRANRLKYNKLALQGGEDYELLFTLAPEDVNNLDIESITKVDQPVTQIGVITAKKGVRLISKNGRSKILQRPMGFNHFKGKA